MKKTKDRATVTWEPYEVNPQVFDSDDPRGLISFTRKLVQDYKRAGDSNGWVISKEHIPALNIAMELLPLSDALARDIANILRILKINDSIRMWDKY
jgi:hypothetical protein